MTFARFDTGNVNISRNIIHNGQAVVNGSTVSYTYASAMAVAPSSVIDSNQLSGVPASLSSVLMNINSDAGSCTITNNIFITPGTLAAYILVSGNIFDQVIKNNYFDDTSANGFTTVLTQGLSATSTYIENINQTGYATLSLTDYAMCVENVNSTDNVSANTTGPSPGAVTMYSNTDFGTVKVYRIPGANGLPTLSNGTGSTYVYIYDTYPGASSYGRNFSFSLPIDQLLPVGVKIFSITMGVVFSLTGPGSSGTLNMSSQDNNQISLTLVANKPVVATPPPNPTNVLPNVQLAYANGLLFPLDTTENIVSSYTVIIDNNTAGSSGPTYNVVSLPSIASTTQYCTVTPTLGQFVTGSGYRIYAEVDINYVGMAAGGTYISGLYLSPLVIQYQW